MTRNKRAKPRADVGEEVEINEPAEPQPTPVKAKRPRRPAVEEKPMTRAGRARLDRLLQKRAGLMQRIRQAKADALKPGKGTKPDTDPDLHAHGEEEWPEEDAGILAAAREKDPLEGIEDMDPKHAARATLPPANAPNDPMPPDEGMMPNTTSQATSQSTLQQLAAQVFENKQLADTLMDPRDIEMKTRMNPALVVQVATAVMVAEENDCPALAAFAYKIMELRVSLLGEGRKEIVEITKGRGLDGLHPDTVSRMRG